jgi:hypothetical protein
MYDLMTSPRSEKSDYEVGDDAGSGWSLLWFLSIPIVAPLLIVLSLVPVFVGLGWVLNLIRASLWAKIKNPKLEDVLLLLSVSVLTALCAIGFFYNPTSP